MAVDFNALLAALVGTIWAYLYHKNDISVVTVGDLPKGLKAPTFDYVPDLDRFEELFIMSFTIAIVGYLESIAVCQIMALKFNYKIDANQELIAIGGANLVGSFFSGFPVVGSFSRTAVNGNTGSRTPLCGIITACIVLLALFLITDWFFYLPLCALAAMVETAVLNLVDFHEMRTAYTLDKRDFFVMIITFATTLGLGVKEGLFTGVVVSMVLVVQHSAFPRIAILGKRTQEGKETQYRDIKRFKDAVEQPGILIVRLDAKLFFANAAKFGEFVLSAVKKRTPSEESDKIPIHAVVIDSRGINDVDLSGLHMLTELENEMKRDDIAVIFCNINDVVRTRIGNSSLKIPEEFLMSDDTQDAVDFINSDHYGQLTAPTFEEEDTKVPGECQLRSSDDRQLEDQRNSGEQTLEKNVHNPMTPKDSAAIEMVIEAPSTESSGAPSDDQSRSCGACVAR